jgi:hypothetical protein
MSGGVADRGDEEQPAGAIFGRSANRRTEMVRVGLNEATWEEIAWNTM